MNRLFLLAILIISVPVAASAAFASPAPSPSLSALYAFYGIQNVNHVSNITYNNSTYVLVHLDNSSTFLVNSTGSKYSLATSPSSIATVISAYLEHSYYPSNSSFSNLSAEMQAYRSTTSEQLNLCLSFTGLRYTSSTVQNGYRSCYDTNYCTQEIAGFGAQFGAGIVNFSETYGAFNQSYNAFLNITAHINQSNYGSKINALYAAALNVSASSAKIPESDIFPVQNVSQSLLSSCPYSFTSTPWYCGSRFIGGFCPSVWFNYTNMSKITNQVSALRSLPVYNSTIYSYASSASGTATGLISAYNERTNTTLFNSMLEYISPLYNSTVKNASFVNSRFDYAPLSNTLAALELKFSAVKSLAYNQNVSAANAILVSMIKNLSATYKAAAATYLPVYNTSTQNNKELSIIKLDYAPGSVPQSLTSLESAQNSINSELSGKVNQTALGAISANALSVGSQLASLGSPFSMAAFVKGTDYWFVSSLFNGSPNPSSASYAYAAALLSLIIGLIILAAAFFATRPKSGHPKSMHHNRKAGKRTIALALLFIMLVLVYPAATYYYAASANSFIPASYFLSKLSSSNTIAVYTGSIASQSCISSISSNLSKSGKSLVSIGNASSSTAYTAFESTLSGKGSDTFSPQNGTTSLTISYSANTTTGSISVYNNASKQVLDFILNGGASESGSQSVSGAASGTWSVKYNLSSSALLKISGTSSTRQSANSITISNAISRSIPVLYASNTTAYKGMLGYVMYMNASMLGPGCTASKLIG